MMCLGFIISILIELGSKHDNVYILTWYTTHFQNFMRANNNWMKGHSLETPVLKVS